MSSIKFFPICWFEDSNWESIQASGKLQNGKSIYVRTKLEPFFTIRYVESQDYIKNIHEYLLDKSPIHKIECIENNFQIYRYYTSNKHNYHEAIRFCENNKIGFIIDKDQEIRSKFFTEHRINPGSWQEATNLSTLTSNLKRESCYSRSDLECYAKEIKSLDCCDQIPPSLNAYFDIKVIPKEGPFSSDFLERSPGQVFAITLLVGTGQSFKNTVYILSQNNCNNYLESERSCCTKIFWEKSEKVLIEKFFKDLEKYRPDRLINTNGGKFHLNNLRERSKELNINIPNFGKIITRPPYFYKSTDDVWELNIPGVSQINISNLYNLLLPQLEAHTFKSLCQNILGKPRLSFLEIIELYKSGSQKNHHDLGHYLASDSICLLELWNMVDSEKHLANLANFWKNDSGRVVSTSKDLLFSDISHYISPMPPIKKYNPGDFTSINKSSGVHRNVHSYSLSNLYLNELSQLEDPFSQWVSEYFRNTGDGIVPFRSGLFDVTFDSIKKLIQNNFPNGIVWFDENSLGLLGENHTNLELNNEYIIPLVIVPKGTNSCVLVNKTGEIIKTGISPVVKPTFILLQKYIDYLIDQIISNVSPIKFPDISSELEDFVLETKVNLQNFHSMNDHQKEIMNQIQEMGENNTRVWKKVRYFQTTKGAIIEKLYLKNPNLYLLDENWYNLKLQEAIESITG